MKAFYDKSKTLFISESDAETFHQVVDLGKKINTIVVTGGGGFLIDALNIVKFSHSIGHRIIVSDAMSAGAVYLAYKHAIVDIDASFGAHLMDSGSQLASLEYTIAAYNAIWRSLERRCILNDSIRGMTLLWEQAYKLACNAPDQVPSFTWVMDFVDKYVHRDSLAVISYERTKAGTLYVLDDHHFAPLSSVVNATIYDENKYSNPSNI
jgi:hypothetical protein